MIQNIRVGILLVGVRWQGGVSYVESLVRAVTTLPKNEQPQLFFIVSDDSLESFKDHEAIVSLFDGIFYVGQDIDKAKNAIGDSFNNVASVPELFDIIDFFYPIMYNAWPNVCSASWVTDFQYTHLPQFSPENEMKWRTEASDKIANEARLIVFSSKDSQGDFRNLYPYSKAITRVLPFHILHHEDWHKGDPVVIQKKHNVPDEFIICCNQFWKHKNHLCLIEAISQLRSNGKDIHLVCTGGTVDYRSPDYFDEVKKTIIDLRIEDLIHIVGNISRSDHIQLIRRSLAVVQPSLFEGWSTVVEESRALGKTIILSDLPVNVEQSPKYAVYFERNSSVDLAETISRLLPTLNPGPDILREKQAGIEANILVEAYGRQFCSIVVEAQFIYNKKIRTISDKLWHLLTEPVSLDGKTAGSEDWKSGAPDSRQFQDQQISIDSDDNDERFSTACPHCKEVLYVDRKGAWQCPSCKNDFVV
jgi:glycosyltransferase involved in cell wall biosynthesis